VPYLIQLPGMGVLTAMAILAAIGEIGRFPSAKRLVGYSGLGASVHASGQTYQTGGITKQGRRELRHVLVEAAWAVIAHHPHWKAVFARLSVRLGRHKAVVAIAHKLLVMVWHVLSEQQADPHADAHKVALKLVVWGRQLGPAGRQGLPTRVFVRRELMRLGLGPIWSGSAGPAYRRLDYPQRRRCAVCWRPVPRGAWWPTLSPNSEGARLPKKPRNPATRAGGSSAASRGCLRGNSVVGEEQGKGKEPVGLVHFPSPLPPSLSQDQGQKLSGEFAASPT
jgi:hypothetical protein